MFVEREDPGIKLDMNIRKGIRASGCSFFVVFKVVLGCVWLDGAGGLYYNKYNPCIQNT